MQAHDSAPGQTASESSILDKALQNQTLIHRILQVDDDEFQTEVTWNGKSRAPTISYDEFNKKFLGRDSEPPSSSTNDDEFPVFSLHVHNLSGDDRTAMAMRISFLQKMKKNIISGLVGVKIEDGSSDEHNLHSEVKYDSDQIESSVNHFQSYQTNIAEMNDMVRRLVPRRRDLHSMLSDDITIPDRTSTSDINESVIALLKPLKAIADSLLQLESPDRDWAIREWTEHCRREQNLLYSNTAVCQNDKLDHVVAFIVTSMTYLHHSIEQTQIDIVNASLVQCAPLLKEHGLCYEKEKFRQQFLIHETLLDIDKGPESVSEEGLDPFSRFDLISKLPHTTIWIKNAMNLVTTGNPCSFSLSDLKTTGFVKALVFTSVAIALPEVLHLDLDTLHDIRRVSQRIVLGTALILQLGVHAPQAEDDMIKTNMLRDDLCRLLSEKNPVLQKLNEDEWRNRILDVLVAYRLSTSGGNLFKESEETSLRMRCLKVFDGTDPVLKLMDSRIREFFIFACGWEHDDCNNRLKDSSSLSSLSCHLQSGRLACHEDGKNFFQGPLIHSSVGTTMQAKTRRRREAFYADSMDKATALKFSIFMRDLTEIGYKTHKLMQLMCDVHGNLLTQHIHQLLTERSMNEVD